MGGEGGTMLDLLGKHRFQSSLSFIPLPTTQACDCQALVQGRKKVSWKHVDPDGACAVEAGRKT